jgi:hypothetical protein
MEEPEFSYNQPVLIPWGLDTVLGHVEQVYGSGPARRVVVRLQPEESGFVVDETTTVTLPIGAVQPVPAVA